MDLAKSLLGHYWGTSCPSWGWNLVVIMSPSSVVQLETCAHGWHRV